MADRRTMLGPTRGPGPRGSEMAEVDHGTVGIVDDDDAVRDSLRFLLEVIGHPVATFASAAEFLKAEIQRCQR
jgi:hypothetical protein